MSNPEHRKLHFENFSEAIAEAERLAQVDTRTTGRFSHGQIIDHLARTLQTVTGDRQAPAVPFLLRAVLRLMRNRVTQKPMKPGTRLPQKVQPLFWSTEDVPLDQAMTSLRQSVQRFEQCDPFPPHPLFGEMTPEQHRQLQCRHFELHLGFIHEA